MTHIQRTIIHFDLDAFFCSVEEQRDPTLRGKSFAVGGRPENRGVVASCSYTARRYGIRSAMPMAKAIRQCPTLIIIQSSHGLYSKVSKSVMEIIKQITSLVQQVSIDEAFIDVSELPISGEVIARQLQTIINNDLGLPCSLGIASNKLVAKIATDVGKTCSTGDSYPNAITVVPPGREATFLAPLPTGALWGVGPKTAKKLAEIGINTIGDLANWSIIDLEKRFGKHGYSLAVSARGIDDSPVVTSHELKSISQEVTFDQDVREDVTLIKVIHELSTKVGKRLRDKQLYGKTVKLKIRWSDFTTLTRQTTFLQPINQDDHIINAVLTLLHRTRNKNQSVRLIGVCVCNLCESVTQLSFWDPIYIPPEDKSLSIPEEKYIT